MNDMRIQYSEEMVGAGHPTKFDTLNRLALVEADADGHGLARYLKARADDPATAAGECALYAKAVGGRLGVFLRAESDGAVTQLASGGRLLPPPRAVSWSKFSDDPNSPTLTRLGPLEAANLPYANQTRVGFQEPVMVPGLAHRLALDLAMSTTSAADITLRLAYRVLTLDGSLAASLTTALWRASRDYAAGDRIIALAADGWREYAVTTDGGSSGAAPPATWPTSGTVADGGLTWTAGSVIFKNLTLVHGVTDSAGEPFRVDSSALQIPGAEITADNQVIAGFLLRQVGAGHAGDLHLIDGHLKTVEV